MKKSRRGWERGRESATLECNYIITSPQRHREGEIELKFVLGWLYGNKEQDGRKLALSNFRNALKPNTNSLWTCVHKSKIITEQKQLVNIRGAIVSTITTKLMETEVLGYLCVSPTIHLRSWQIINNSSYNIWIK